MKMWGKKYWGVHMRVIHIFVLGWLGCSVSRSLFFKVEADVCQCFSLDSIQKIISLVFTKDSRNQRIMTVERLKSRIWTI